MALGYHEQMVDWLAADGATTEYTIGSLGFTPKAVMVVCMGYRHATSGHIGTVDWRVSIGFAESGGTRRCVSSYSQDASAAANCGVMARNDAVLATCDGSAGLTGALDIAFDSDGIRLIVDDTAPVDLSVLVKIWGGDDISAVVVGDIAEPAATGNVDYTATGMASGANSDQVLFLAGVQSTAALNTAQAQDSGICFGMAHDSGQWVNVVNSDDASTTMDTDHYSISGGCLAMIVIAGGNPNARASFTQWNTDGFRLNWAARATTNRRNIFMAIKGGQWAVGETTIDASTASSTATVSGLAFQPAGLVLATTAGAEEASATSATLAAMSIGGGTSTSSRRCLMARDDNGSADSQVWLGVRDDCALGMQNNSAGSRERFDINAINSDGFQLITDQANAADVTNWWIGYAAFASEPSGGVITKDMPDSLAVSDERVQSRFRNDHFAESLVINDERHSGIVRGRHMGDAITGLSDVQHIVRVRGRLMGDATGALMDQMWLGRTRGRLMGDGIMVTDDMRLGRQRFRMLDDTAVIIDHTFLSRDRNRIMNDALSVSEHLIVTRYVNKTMFDFVSLLDQFTKEITSGGGGSPVFTVVLSDVVLLADEILAHRERNRGLADSVALTDGTILGRHRLRHLSETLSITDAELHFLLRTVEATDSIQVSDGQLLFRLRFRDFVDSLEPTDDFLRTIVLPNAPMTLEVRVRLGQQRDAASLGIDRGPALGMHAFADIGQDATVALGQDAGPTLGGYN